MARGGAHSIDNIQITDGDVNLAKRTMTNEEFIVMCCEVADWQRAKQLRGTG